MVWTNCLLLSSRYSTIWTNGDWAEWGIYASPGPDESFAYKCVIRVIMVGYQLANITFNIYLWIYILNWVRTNFPYKLLWTIMDTLWTVVITQPLSIVVGKHFTVTIIKLPNVISRILIIHLLPIYFCTSSCYVRAAICLEGRLSLLALSSVYSLTVEDGSWSTPMVPVQLSVPL